MDVSTLKSHIKLKTVPAFLIFSGDEWKVQDIYIKQIAKVTGKEIRYIDSVLDIYSNLRNRSFVQKSYIYKVRDDKELMQNEKLQQQIREGLLGDNILILLLTTVDKRTKFYKAYKDVICDFERLSDVMLKKYILKEITLSESNLQRLIDICEHDYGRILLEIDKIKWFEKWNTAPNITSDDCFKVLLEKGTIYEPPYDAIFDLVNAIMDRNVNLTFDLLQQSYDVGEATMVMLSVLYNNFKNLLQVKTYQGNDMVKGTGLTPWQIKCVKPYVGKHDTDGIIYKLRLITKVTNGIKTGKMEDEFAMQYLLVHIM